MSDDEITAEEAARAERDSFGSRAKEMTAAEFLRNSPTAFALYVSQQEGLKPLLPRVAEEEDRDDPSERIMDAVMARLDGCGDGRGFNGDCPKTRDEVTAIIRGVLRPKT